MLIAAIKATCLVRLVMFLAVRKASDANDRAMKISARLKQQGEEQTAQDTSPVTSPAGLPSTVTVAPEDAKDETKPLNTRKTRK